MKKSQYLGRRRFIVSMGAAAMFAAFRTPTASTEETGMDVIDSHLHFWDPKVLTYSWLKGSELLNRSFLPADYAKASEGCGVSRILFVQAECLPGQAVAEVDWVTSLAKDGAPVAGIVACAPVEMGKGVTPTLEHLAANPLVKGIRRLVQGEEDPEYCLRPDFVAGVKCLAPHDFVFELGVNRGQLPHAVELVRRCPEVRFALNHLGFPAIRQKELEPWSTHIKEMAALPNIICKVSGAATSADPKSWTTEDLAPYVNHVLSCFGFERCAYGSDWPVMLMATDFRRWFDALRSIVSAASTEQRNALFHGTATRWYEL